MGFRRDHRLVLLGFNCCHTEKQISWLWLRFAAVFTLGGNCPPLLVYQNTGAQAAWSTIVNLRNRSTKTITIIIFICEATGISESCWINMENINEIRFEIKLYKTVILVVCPNLITNIQLNKMYKMSDKY